jgi:hypothetical protein
MQHYDAWKDDYAFDPTTGEFHLRKPVAPGGSLCDFDPLPKAR